MMCIRCRSGELSRPAQQLFRSCCSLGSKGCWLEQCLRGLLLGMMMMVAVALSSLLCKAGRQAARPKGSLPETPFGLRQNRRCSVASEAAGMTARNLAARAGLPKARR